MTALSNSSDGDFVLLLLPLGAGLLVLALIASIIYTLLKRRVTPAKARKIILSTVGGLLLIGLLAINLL